MDLDTFIDRLGLLDVARRPRTREWSTAAQPAATEAARRLFDGLMRGMGDGVFRYPPPAAAIERSVGLLADIATLNWRVNNTNGPGQRPLEQIWAALRDTFGDPLDHVVAGSALDYFETGGVGFGAHGRLVALRGGIAGNPQAFLAGLQAEIRQWVRPGLADPFQNFRGPLGWITLEAAGLRIVPNGLMAAVKAVLLGATDAANTLADLNDRDIYRMPSWISNALWRNFEAFTHAITIRAPIQPMLQAPDAPLLLRADDDPFD